MLPQNLSVHLYNPKQLSEMRYFDAPLVQQGSFLYWGGSKILNAGNRDERSVDLDENNIVFRLFVWRDMAHELIEQEGMVGF